MNLSAVLVTITKKFKAIGQFFVSHNRMIYFVLFLSVVIGTVASLNLALYQQSDEDYRNKKLSETQSAKFDSVTIKKIKNLNANQQTNTDSLPTGKRINPFGE